MALKRFDLLGTVTDLISVDEFEPKTGTSNELIVVAFYVFDEGPAKDLDSFIERSYIQIIDVDVSPNPNEDGYYLVFIEMKRSKTFIPDFYALVKEVSRIAGNQDWKISPYLSDKMFKIDDTRWERYVITDENVYVTKDEYESSIKSEKMAESIKQHFKNSNLKDLVIENKKITFTGRSGVVQANILAFCNTKKLNESFDMVKTPVLWEKTSVEQKLLKDCLGEGWTVVHHGSDLLITNDWSQKITRVNVICY